MADTKEQNRKRTAAKEGSDPVGAAARVRAFEDDHFGKDAVRIEGKIERGVGSPFAAMNDEQKAQYAALEALVAAEQKLDDATAAAAQAEADRAAAEANLAACEKAMSEKGAPEPAPKAPAAAGGLRTDGPTVAEFVAKGYKARDYPPAGYASRSTDKEVADAIAKEKADAT